MFEWITSPEAWIALGTLEGIEESAKVAVAAGLGAVLVQVAVLDIVFSRWPSRSRC